MSDSFRYFCTAESLYCTIASKLSCSLDRVGKSDWPCLALKAMRFVELVKKYICIKNSLFRRQQLKPTSFNL